MKLLDALYALRIQAGFEKPLGIGRFSRVYPGEFIGNNGKEIAIKIYSSDGSEFDRAIFERDIKIQENFSSLKKTAGGVIKVYDFHFNRRFLNFAILERGSEITLEGLIENSKDFLLSSKIKILEDIASAIYSIHQEGYVHNDIKPGNIIFERNTTIKSHPDKDLLCEVIGKPKLTDFGAAKLIGERIRSILVTPQYANPDLLKEDRFNVNLDIYSLGALAYEFLSFNSFPAQLQLAKSGNSCLILHTEVPLELTWPTTFNTKTHKKIIEIIERMLSRKPTKKFEEDKRYSSMNEAIRDLREVRESLEKAEIYY